MTRRVAMAVALVATLLLSGCVLRTPWFTADGSGQSCKSKAKCEEECAPSP